MVVWMKGKRYSDSNCERAPVWRSRYVSWFKYVVVRYANACYSTIHFHVPVVHVVCLVYSQIHIDSERHNRRNQNFNLRYI